MHIEGTCQEMACTLITQDHHKLFQINIYHEHPITLFGLVDQISGLGYLWAQWNHDLYKASPRLWSRANYRPGEMRIEYWNRAFRVFPFAPFWA